MFTEATMFSGILLLAWNI